MGILIDRRTSVLIQGITGREASFFTKQCLEYGTRIVAGVTPCRGGREVFGVPVYDSVKQAKSKHRIDASVISVPPFAVREAAFEAIENGLRLVVIITERVPRRDACEVISFAEERGARLIGPNSLGIISPAEIKLGGIGGDLENTLKTFKRGPIGLISRSGGMTSEIANLLTQNGIGQSTCISVGGDPIVGSNFTDLFPLFQEDPQTEAIVLFCEPGGSMEEQFAEFYSSQRDPKPVAAFVAGRFVDTMPGTRFGHAAVIVEGDRGSTKKKIQAFQTAGVLVADKLSDFPKLVKEITDDKNL